MDAGGEDKTDDRPAQGPVVAVVSLLHEPATCHSATRRLFDEPVLAHTLGRLGECAEVDATAVVCWQDQVEAVAAVADGSAEVVPVGDRSPTHAVEAIALAQRWADGWRGGLLSTCPPDRGWWAPAVKVVADATDAWAVLSVDASFALLDSDGIDALIRHARQQREDLAEPVFFTPAAPGLTALLVRRATVDALAANEPDRQHPGRLLHYRPESPRIDPVGLAACRHSKDGLLARTLADFRADSARQIRGLETWLKNGADYAAALPAGEGDVVRELTVELTTRRGTDPVWIERGEAVDLDLDVLASALSDLIASTTSPSSRHPTGGGAAPVDASNSGPPPAGWRLSEACKDLRITLAGRGDPLCHPRWMDAIAILRSAGASVHVETDLLCTDLADLARLVASGVDIISVHLPAMTAATYAAVMNRNAMATALRNLTTLLALRKQRAGLPIVVPTFVKLRANVGEMEAWYDQWLAAAGSAVIRGPDALGNKPPGDPAILMAAPLARTDRHPPELRLWADGSWTDELGRSLRGDPAGLWQQRNTMSTAHKEAA